MEAEQRLAIKEKASRNRVLSPKPCKAVPAAAVAVGKSTYTFPSLETNTSVTHPLAGIIRSSNLS